MAFALSFTTLSADEAVVEQEVQQEIQQEVVIKEEIAQGEDFQIVADDVCTGEGCDVEISE